MALQKRYLIWPCVVAATLAVYAQTIAMADGPHARENYYAAGNSVHVMQAVPGDVVVAGRTIRIAGPVAGDILAAGWSVTLSGGANDDVRIAGGDVRLGPNARVAGRAWLTGGTVRVEGLFDRDLQVAGGSVQIGGELRRPVHIVAENLEILPTARILAPLSYRSPREARIHEGATIAGPVSFQQIPQREAERARAWPAVSSVFFIIQVFFAGALLLLFVPRWATSMVTTLRAQPGMSFLLGFVLLVTIPIAALILIVSIFGLPVGFVLAGLYGAALLVGVVTTSLLIGEFEIRALGTSMMATRAKQLLVLLAGVVTLGLLRLLPIIGAVVVPISILFGLGALGLWLYHRNGQLSADLPA